MEGIQFLIDENGRPKSVIIDLEVHGNLWENIYDELIEEGNPLIGRNVIPWEGNEGGNKGECRTGAGEVSGLMPRRLAS